MDGGLSTCRSGLQGHVGKGGTSECEKEKEVEMDMVTSFICCQGDGILEMDYRP